MASKRAESRQGTPQPLEERHWTSVNVRFRNTQSFELQTKPKQEVCDKLSKHAHTDAGGCTPLRKDEHHQLLAGGGRGGGQASVWNKRRVPGRCVKCTKLPWCQGVLTPITGLNHVELLLIFKPGFPAPGLTVPHCIRYSEPSEQGPGPGGLRCVGSVFGWKNAAQKEEVGAGVPQSSSLCPSRLASVCSQAP